MDSMADTDFHQLRSDIATLVMKACGLRGLPDVRIKTLGLVALVEIRVFKDDLGTVALGTSSFAKELKALAQAATGKEKIVYEIVEE